VVVPGVAHHVTQRGDRRQRTFFAEEDYAAYLSLLGEWCRFCGVAVWAYCLMPNHVHLTLVPDHEGGLRRGLAETHRRYTQRINFREGWRGYLWQGRFASFAMDERYLLRAARYVELNPVRAKLCRIPWRWPWSSAVAQIAGCDGGLVRVGPLLERVKDWREFLTEAAAADEAELLRHHARTGHPLGEATLLDHVEQMLRRVVRPAKRGPKPKPQ
jgi:putative transposase